jgi:hypothetical protein
MYVWVIIFVEKSGHYAKQETVYYVFLLYQAVLGVNPSTAVQQKPILWKPLEHEAGFLEPILRSRVATPAL